MKFLFRVCLLVAFLFFEPAGGHAQFEYPEPTASPSAIETPSSDGTDLAADNGTSANTAAISSPTFGTTPSVSVALHLAGILQVVVTPEPDSRGVTSPHIFQINLNTFPDREVTEEEDAQYVYVVDPSDTEMVIRPGDPNVLESRTADLIVTNPLSVGFTVSLETQLQALVSGVMDDASRNPSTPLSAVQIAAAEPLIGVVAESAVPYCRVCRWARGAWQATKVVARVAFKVVSRVFIPVTCGYDMIDAIRKLNKCSDWETWGDLNKLAIQSGMLNCFYNVFTMGYHQMCTCTATKDAIKDALKPMLLASNPELADDSAALDALLDKGASELTGAPCNLGENTCWLEQKPGGFLESCNGTGESSLCANRIREKYASCKNILAIKNQLIVDQLNRAD